ncbi:NAD-dependent epimerase/dehydratase family protein [Micromonospora olivasterospora]|uniref:Nucleoside-diphosphate-sugar epimerase n=1 Tax=Micromonospora olivasterospora TaxID=1880 RepID=A0A562IFB8_MICOL|nr:NAD-dependent epimerase/dehydratase family protein [Micromonospora olivasterospora]TWH69294.1 nucleoside-diphosphate-sugar epimerase [Micromonospora olivasterospora]
MRPDTRPVLLFGATGFLGGHVRAALAAELPLVCPSRPECDLEGATSDELAALIRAVRPAAVVNCAGRATGTAEELLRANALVAAKLVDAVAEAAPAARLVRLGSAAEYGRVPLGSAVGEDCPADPVAAYGVSQLAATRLVELAARDRRVDAVVLRVFNPVGPGTPRSTLLGGVAAQLARCPAGGVLRTGPLDVRRDFVDVRDVAAAVAAALRVPPSGPRVFNVASGRAVPVRDAVRLLADAAGFTGWVREDGRPPARSATVGWMCGDVRRAAAHLGWTPRHDLADSIKALWAGASSPARAADPGPGPSRPADDPSGPGRDRQTRSG